MRREKILNIYDRERNSKQITDKNTKQNQNRRDDENSNNKNYYYNNTNKNEVRANYSKGDYNKYSRRDSDEFYEERGSKQNNKGEYRKNKNISNIDQDQANLNVSMKNLLSEKILESNTVLYSYILKLNNKNYLIVLDFSPKF